jgi:hypothetical protein
MANIFRKKDAYIDRVNRSTFDLSFVNNLTMKFGAITPVCLLPASFGDSFQINARFNLQLLPTVFPIQTQLYVRLHFVYVRTRTLWEDWMSFFGGDETVTPPWINPTAGDTPQGHQQFNVADDLQTGTLADYLGVPTTITGSYGRTYESNKAGYDRLTGITFSANISSDPVIASPVFPAGQVVGSPDASIADFYVRQHEKSLAQLFVSNDWAGPSVGYKSNYIGIPYVWNVDQVGLDNIEFRIPTKWFANFNNPFWVGFYNNTGAAVCQFSYVEFTSDSIQGDYYVVSAPKSVFTGTTQIVFWVDVRKLKTDYVVVKRVSSYRNGSGSRSGELYSIDVLKSFHYTVSSNAWTKPEAANCPFYTSASDVLPSIPLSALPFRAYESYYNAFGRDIRNNPFVVDGKPEYNRYVPSLKGGSDTYKYQLHYANWEPDAYTTALQSPQAGVAPLVGITSLGEATFRDAAGTEYHAQLETAEDGDTVTGFQVKSSNAPADVVRNLIGMATSGISISDFRNVNSLQRFLEIRIRQSPRYKNLVKGLFDVNLDYDELMMPEFLGGISDTIPVYKVTQTTPTEGNPLGSFAGQGSLQSGMRHVIRKYCPEDGYILGVMSVVPAANYSQLLAPHFTRMNLLDWHFPQFNNISYQPMLYKNLCPYQAFAVNPANINNVFGYQRAYWDLISSFDEVHGEFRGSMRNFLINRVFDKAPELSKDFLLVNPDHVNDVFAMTSESGDKILGSIAFDITKKTTIPRNSIPHIE